MYIAFCYFWLKGSKDSWSRKERNRTTIKLGGKPRSLVRCVYVILGQGWERDECLFCSLVYATSFSVLTFSQRQRLAYFLANPHYGSLINADGHAEVWTDWNDMSKFSQYGWRCTTNENAYSNRTLMGNWNQERYDLRNIVQPKPLPSQVT